MFEYYAKVLKVVDGDTIDVMVDLGWVFTARNAYAFPASMLGKSVANTKRKASSQKLELPNLFLSVKKLLLKLKKIKEGSSGGI